MALMIPRAMAAMQKRKMRNAKCPCKSGLKFKHCHGDEEKRRIAGEIANLAMAVLIQYRRHSAGIVNEQERDSLVGQLQEHMMDLLDPDVSSDTPNETTVEILEKTERGEDAKDVDNVGQLMEEMEKTVVEPEVGGEEKLTSIRKSAGIGRCPECLGVMLANEDRCYKCKKGQ
jgi:hypothetical protein